MKNDKKDTSFDNTKPLQKEYNFKPGVSGNANGRPKGSRNKFAESFIKDFLFDWELDGADAIARVRKEDPSTYLRVAASILPKELNINEESTLEKLIEQLDDKQLDALLIGITTIGIKASRGKIENKKTIGVNSERL